MDFPTFKNEVKLTWRWARGKFVRAPRRKVQELDKPAVEVNTPPRDITIGVIAIVLDGEVQEVIRAQDRMAALFLSNPEFVEIPEELKPKPTIGWKYENYEFVNPNPQTIDESQIKEYIPETTAE
jgi:hypothetical protein